MSGIISKLFTQNGKVPWIQLIVGIVVGIIASMGYIKYKKPAFILSKMGLPAGDAVCALPPKKKPDAPLRATAKTPSRTKKPARDLEVDLDDVEYNDIISSRVFPVPIFAVSEDIPLPQNSRQINELDDEDQMADVDDDDDGPESSKDPKSISNVRG